LARERSEGQRQSAVTGYLSILISSALFGSVFTLAKVPLDTVDPLVLSAVVYTIAGLSLIPFAKASFRLDTSRDYYYLAIITIFGAIAAPVLLLYGLEQTQASDAAILANSEIVFTLILAAIFFSEKPHGRLGIVAAVLVVTGLFIATTDLKLSDTIIELNEGNIMILVSMFMWAIDNNVSRRLTSNVSPAKIAMIKSLAGGLVLLMIALAVGKWPALTRIEPTLWLVIVGMSVSGFGGALLFFLHGIKRIGTVKTMSMFSMTPIFGIFIAALALGESISVFQGIATGLIIAGILLISRH
jgi:drug/metabolite transporter (DMT)-like permease